MRQLIENPVYMTPKEIYEAYDGKWVYIIKCNYEGHHHFLGGYPVVIADKIFEGQQDGFYNQFDGKEFAPRTDRDYRNIERGVRGAFSIKFLGEVPNAAERK